MKNRTYATIAGLSYLVIFVAAIFANFFALESLRNDPMRTITERAGVVRWGVVAFMVTVVFDVVVAWALFELFRGHVLNLLAAAFRMLHAGIMAVAVAFLPWALSATTAGEVLHYADTFNIIWLTGLFFFGIHLFLLGLMLKKPRFIAIFLLLAGIMYVADTCAHFLLPDYSKYAQMILLFVAVPSMFGEMALALWLLLRGRNLNRS